MTYEVAIDQMVAPNVTAVAADASTKVSISKPEHFPGSATITLTANAAPEGKVFDKWVVTGASVADATKATTTFTMPATNVIANATYKDKPVTPPTPTTYIITVTNGTASKVSVSATNKNTVTEVNGYDTVKIDEDELEYIVQGTQTKKVSIDKNAKYIYNSNIDSEFDSSKIALKNTVSIRLIDNNNDGLCDVVFVYEYESRVAKSIFAETKTITLNKEYNGGKGRDFE